MNAADKGRGFLLEAVRRDGLRRERSPQAQASFYTHRASQQCMAASVSVESGSAGRFPAPAIARAKRHHCPGFVGDVHGKRE